jgi:hypothetical protein
MNTFVVPSVAAQALIAGVAFADQHEQQAERGQPGAQQPNGAEETDGQQTLPPGQHEIAGIHVVGRDAGRRWARDGAR